ncbi:MAG: ABC transporter ATP-binding protein [Chloroflexi bacterium]|nr:ABC transporter ATP-binding protein [Chloroflexota bacterium]
MNQTTTSHPMVRLMRYAKTYQMRVVWATLFSILNRLMDLTPPVLIGAAVDVVVSQENSILSQFGITNTSTQLTILAIITVFVWLGESVFEYLFSILWRNLAQSLQHDLRITAYNHVQNLDMGYFEDQSTGGLMAVLNDDINQLERFLDSGANDMIQLVTTVITISSLFLFTVPTVSWMAILPMPFVLWGSLWFQKKLAPRYAKVRERVGMLNSQLANNLGGIATIKSFTSEAHEVARIGRESDLYSESNRDAIVLSSAFVPIIRMLIVAGFAAIMIYGGRLVLAGQLNVGVYSVLIFMTQRLLWPMTRLGTMLDLYQRAMASAARILDLLDVQPQIHDGAVGLPLDGISGDVRFEQVSFQYGVRNGRSTPNQPTVIQNLSFHIRAGETAAFVGATGAGKSTVIKLMLRFYDVTSGQVCLDGHDLRTLRRADLRGAIGLVSQDVYLFHGTVLENIAYGSFDASMDEIIAAAKIAEAHEFIQALPDRYDTIVGERGQKLSGGQRQRISIARAVLKDPPVLILDEATSSVDNETEAAIQRSMEKIAIGRTTIVIAHRLSTVRNADRIFVLEQGQLREQGQHDDLVKDDGIYASLWRVQTGVR